MGETSGTTRSETKFPSSCEYIKSNKLRASKIQWRDRYRIDIPLPKGRNRKEDPKLNRANYIKSCE